MASNNIARYNIRIDGNTANLVRQLGLGGKAGEAFGATFLKVAASLGALRLGQTAGRIANDFQNELQQSLAIQDVTGPLRDEFARTAIETARDVKASAQEVAEGYFFLASAGQTAAQQLQSIGTVARFAQAGAFNLATATDLLTDAQSALGLVVPDATENLQNLTRISDVLIGANTLANATAQQFSESITNKFGAALRALGKDVEEGTALLAAFADQGVKGAEAGTQGSIVLRDLQTKAIQNAEAFERFGVTVFDQAGEFLNIAQVIGSLEVALDGLSDKAQKSTLLELGFSDKSVASIQTLLGTSDKIEEYEAALRRVQGITDEVADKQFTPFGEAANSLGKALVELAISFSPLLDEAVPLLDFLTSTTRAAIGLADIFVTGLIPVLRPFGVAFSLAGQAIDGTVSLLEKAGNIVQLLLLNFTKFTGVAAAAVAQFFGDDVSVEETLASYNASIEEFLNPEPLLKQGEKAGQAISEGLSAGLEENLPDNTAAVSSLLRSIESPLEEFERKLQDAVSLSDVGAIDATALSRFVAKISADLIKQAEDIEQAAALEQAALEALAALAPTNETVGFGVQIVGIDAAQREFDKFIENNRDKLEEALIPERLRGTLSDVAAALDSPLQELEERLSELEELRFDGFLDDQTARNAAAAFRTEALEGLGLAEAVRGAEALAEALEIPELADIGVTQDLANSISEFNDAIAKLELAVEKGLIDAQDFPALAEQFGVGLQEKIRDQLEESIPEVRDAVGQGGATFLGTVEEFNARNKARSALNDLVRQQKRELEIQRQLKKVMEDVRKNTRARERIEIVNKVKI